MPGIHIEYAQEIPHYTRTMGRATTRYDDFIAGLRDGVPEGKVPRIGPFGSKKQAQLFGSGLANCKHMKAYLELTNQDLSIRVRGTWVYLDLVGR